MGTEGRAARVVQAGAAAVSVVAVACANILGITDIAGLGDAGGVGAEESGTEDDGSSSSRTGSLDGSPSSRDAGTGASDESSTAAGGDDSTGASSDSSNGAGSDSGTGAGSDSSTGAGVDSSRDSSGAPSGPSPTMLPTASVACPTIAAGATASSLTFAGEPVEIWAGTPTAGQNGPLVLFWFETGGGPGDVTDQFGQAQITAVTAQGGIVASFGKSTGTGTDTFNDTWFTGDFNTADEVVACAIQQFHIDTRRIFTLGASAGAVQATWMAYARSGYLAAAASLSGGLAGRDAGVPLQDPTNVPAAMAIHGALGTDVVFVDFAQASATYEADVASKGGFSMDCNTGGGHVSGPPAICPGIYQFFEDHPFKVSPQPYPPIPAVFPSYCKIGPRAADGGAP